MAATFRSVNNPVVLESKTDDTMATSPTTPTPTKTSFGQRPLPNSPFPQAVQIPEKIDEKWTPPRRENSQPIKRSRGNSEDVDMDESDGENHGDDGGGSDDESVNADGSRSKKKKSQRFYCTDYPPCNLSFTRSEHLARHIRKHTGERPFQCHCSRRFSRLDNLRQHAQTVHVNEDIPMNSLAATGTRFQRQIRTDRVRTSTGRARTSSNAGMGAPAKGHSKSLSTSSISSVGSTFSGRDEVRRRPPPLVMADPRSRLPIESYQRSPGEGAYALRPVSPSEFSTPTSATFSTAQSSPRWASSIASPTSSHSRSHSMYASSRIPARRLSVPSGGIPFHSPHGAPFGRPPYGSSSSTSTAGPYSPISSVMASPTSSVFSRRESTVSNADEAWRRRTWHPDSSNFGGMPSSRLSNAYTPSQLQSPVAGGTPPMANQATLQQAPLRLPGIESFDPVHRPATPPRRNPSPMMVDADSSHPPPRLLPAADVHSDGRRNTANWGMSLHQGLTRLDLKNKTPPRDEASAWAQETSQAVEAEAERARYNVPTVRFNEPVVVYDAPPVRMNSPSRPSHQHTMSAPAFSRPREARRHGWYQSPVEVHADGPPERIARVDRMVHPNINQFPGFPAREAPSPPQPSAQDAPGDRDNMLRLQALVAVATSEGNAAKAY